MYCYAPSAARAGYALLVPPIEKFRKSPFFRSDACREIGICRTEGDLIDRNQVFSPGPYKRARGGIIRLVAVRLQKSLHRCHQNRSAMSIPGIVDRGSVRQGTEYSDTSFQRPVVWWFARKGIRDVTSARILFSSPEISYHTN